MAKNFASPAGLARIATIVLGVIVMGIGLYSHFQSTWAKEPEVRIPGMPPLAAGKKLYEVCKLLDDAGQELEEPCPSISMEHYYVSMIIICFILSLVGLIASFLIDLSSKPMKFVDLGYHAVAAILLLIAAIVYIVSAVQIHNFHTLFISDELLEALDAKELKVEKLAAAGLTIVQALVYGVTALLIARQ